MRLRAFIGNILAVFISVILCFLFLEIVLRLVSPREAQLKKDNVVWENEFKFYEYDPLLGWKNRPGAEGVFKVPDTTTFVSINSKGLRDIEHDYERDEGPRILVLGDSFVWGYGVEQGERFTDYLQGLLGSRAEIINAGVSGYGTDQELLYYISEGVKYSPDLVILAFGTFDAKFENVQPVAHTYPKPYFILEGERLSLQNVPVPERKGYRWEDKDELEKMYREGAATKTSLNKKIRKYLRKRFRTYAFISDGIKNVRGNIRDLFKSNPRMLDYMVREKSREKEDPFFIITAEIVNELNREVTSNNAKLAVLMVTYRSHLRKLPDSLYGKMLHFCESRNILCIDPYGKLFERYRNGEKLYFEHDEHWNSTAHRLVAEEIYETLIKKGILALCQ